MSETRTETESERWNRLVRECEEKQEKLTRILYNAFRERPDAVRSILFDCGVRDLEIWKSLADQREAAWQEWYHKAYNNPVNN